MSEVAENLWLAEQRSVATAYLEKEGIGTPELGESPAFHVSPYVSLWAVRSKKSPGSVGWWVIAGDLPTDYLSASDAREPRLAVGVFAKQWKEASARMLRGEDTPGIKIGTTKDQKSLGDLLNRRADLLRRCSEDSELWQENG
jgi:hypothetical protein